MTVALAVLQSVAVLHSVALAVLHSSISSHHQLTFATGNRNLFWPVHFFWRLQCVFVKEINGVVPTLYGTCFSFFWVIFHFPVCLSLFSFSEMQRFFWEKYFPPIEFLRNGLCWSVCHFFQISHLFEATSFSPARLNRISPRFWKGEGGGGRWFRTWGLH